MNNLRTLLYLCLTLLTTSCLEGEFTESMSSSFDHYVYDCEYEDNGGNSYLGEEDLALVEMCHLNRFETTEEVEQNIIGEFELIAIANNWNSTTQPCMYIWFEETSTAVVHISNSEIDTLYRTKYEVNENRVELEHEAYFYHGTEFINLCDEYLTTITSCDDCYTMIFERRS